MTAPTPDAIEAITAAIGKADKAFGYSLRLTRLVDGVSTYTLSMDGFDPIEIEDQDEAYCLIAERRNRSRADVVLAAIAHSAPEASAGGVSRDSVIRAMRAYVTGAGVPESEFDPEFCVRMMAAMMVSFHKYGRVAQAYPVRFDAASDVRARMTKYRQTGNKHYLVDAANFAMIESMHSSREAAWGENDAADSPGRTTASGHRLVQEDNDGNRLEVER